MRPGRGVAAATAAIVAVTGIVAAPGEAAAALDAEAKDLLYTGLLGAAGLGVLVGAFVLVDSVVRKRKAARRRAYEAMLAGVPAETRRAPAPVSSPETAAPTSAPASAPATATTDGWFHRSTGLAPRPPAAPASASEKR